MLVLMAAAVLPAKAQFYNLPNEYSFSLLGEKQLAEKDPLVHSEVKPYIHFFSPKYLHVADSHNVFKFIKDDPAVDFVFYNHFLKVEPKKEKFKLRLDPLINLELGRDQLYMPGVNLYTNMRGLIASAYVGDKVYFESMFAENQSAFPLYLYNYANASLIVPGQGRWKSFKTNGYDYAFSSGFVSIQALKNLNIQFGHGKQKIGNGYRSLLLSDNAFNYPYARITQQWFKGRVQYTNIYAVFMNMVSASKYVNPNTERLFQKKAASFQYLSFNPSRFLSIGLFQGMIWKAGDAHNKQHLDWHYFNPVIFSNLPAYGLDNQNNILAGADLKLKLTDKLNVYGQLMLDGIKHDTLKARNGYQAGIHYFDAFGIRNFFLQLEYNQVSQGSYGNVATASDQSYFHYNQNLAYTPARGNELIVVADYRKSRFFANLRYHYQEVPPPDNTGGRTSYVKMIHAKVGYLINSSYNLNLCLGMIYRTQNFSIFNPLINQSNYVYVGFKTSIYNIYYDF